MAAPAASNNSAISQDTPITIKVVLPDGINVKKLKLPLRDLGASVLPDKLRQLLGYTSEQAVVFERFSDSAGGYITLDPNNPQVFKTLVRAAKAKLKLRLKASVPPVAEEEKPEAAEMLNEAVSQGSLEPVIVRSPVYQNNQRDSTAFDRRSIGSGIFEFREARASQQTLVDTTEAPVPHPFDADNKEFPGSITAPGAPRELAFRSREPAVVTTGGHPWSVYCNECDVAMVDAHFHCDICDGGDYDLCERCVADGKVCPGEGHWLIKRFIKDGKVIKSTTERICPPQARSTPAVEAEVEKEIPGAFTDDTKTLAEEPRVPTRTCNSCVIVLPEREFVTCNSCEDYDLCIKCHNANKHGHHPAHGFKPATEETILPLAAQTLLAPGRNVRHNAICDGCDKKIVGVRHKCLNCPDWDYCNECIKNARNKHPRHRFAAIYTPIGDAQTPALCHKGIYCDGPLCSGKNNQSYIIGVRYKCAICHDTDFCASCEALPSNTHNRTHPLVKFKSPVAGCTITAQPETAGVRDCVLGDQFPQSAPSETKSTSTETTPVPQANAATQVQTVAEIKPTVDTEKSEQNFLRAPLNTKPKPAVPASLLEAKFVKDTIPDGSIFAPGVRLTQVWTMANVGQYPWPSGCSVRFVGGDNMLDVDNLHPSASSDLANASESNVLGRDIKPGEQAAFRVTMKAPLREGKHISYWRMKAADGTPFGNRLWCDITVKKPQEAPAPEVKLAPVVPQPVGSAPYVPSFDLPQQSQMSRMQAIRQQQMHFLQHQQMLAQQAQTMRANAAQTQPPPFDSSTNPANIATRIAAMREQQARRREQMMEKFNAMREQQALAPSEQGEDEKLRKEAARVRMENAKAKVCRAREEKMKALEAARAQKAAAEEKKTAAEEKKVEASEKVKKIIEEVSNQVEEKKVEEDVESSQMVFPKLDKESPASSTYESATSSSGKGKAAYVENEAGEIERSASPSVASAIPDVTSPAVEADYEDLDEGFEVMSAEESESDDGFVTDEEWDVLDASDAETLAEH